jgi:hypothetical protein
VSDLDKKLPVALNLTVLSQLLDQLQSQHDVSPGSPLWLDLAEALFDAWGDGYTTGFADSNGPFRERA